MIDQVMDKKSFRFTGWHMAMCMLAFFGVIIAVNFTMATLASRSWTGLVVKNSYVASQHFNTELAAAKAQKLTGWHSAISYENGTISFVLVDKQNKVLSVENPVISIGRPAFEQQDSRNQMQVQTDGTAIVEVMLAKGEWEIRIDAQVNGKPYRRDARMYVDGNFSGTLQ